MTMLSCVGLCAVGWCTWRGANMPAMRCARAVPGCCTGCVGLLATRVHTFLPLACEYICYSLTSPLHRCVGGLALRPARSIIMIGCSFDTLGPLQAGTLACFMCRCVVAPSFTRALRHPVLGSPPARHRVQHFLQVDQQGAGVYVRCAPLLCVPWQAHLLTIACGARGCDLNPRPLLPGSGQGVPRVSPRLPKH